jgi:hypothetical protein
VQTAEHFAPVRGETSGNCEKFVQRMGPSTDREAARCAWSGDTIPGRMAYHYVHLRLVARRPAA